MALKDIVVIGITNYRLNMSGSYNSRHRLLNEENHKCDIEGLTFHFLDLERFPFMVDQLDDLKENIEAWCFYLKFIHSMDETAVSNFTEKFPIMKTPIDKLSKFSLTKKEFESYVFSQMDKDEISAEEYARDCYAKEKLIEAAKKLLATGVSIDIICSTHGLKREDFE